jgi:pilus assembly protein CpaE
MLKARQAENHQGHALLISPDADLHQQVKAALGAAPPFGLKALYAPVTAADQHAKAFSGVSVILIDFDPSRVDEVSALHKIMEGLGDGIPIIAITRALDPAGVREVFKLRVDDWIPKPITEPSSLVDACERAVVAARASGGGSKAVTCYTFLSAASGAGATTLAIETAFLIAQKSKSFGTTCLIDLDFQAGAISDNLDLPPNLNFDEIGPSPDRLDRQLLEVMLSRHETNLAVLATENHFLDPDLVASILGLASTYFDSLVIDLPNAWLPFAENVLLASNRVFIIADMSVPGIRRARALVDAVMERFEGQVDPEVIINKYDRALLGNTLTKKDALALFEERFAGLLPLKHKLLREARDRGVALYEIERRNKIDKALSQILFKT